MYSYLPLWKAQGVLLGKESIVVAYDWLRGEPRGKISKAATPSIVKGDCIDCRLCVHVCPTGIDIRNGTQLECVNCTACIDACDEVMLKVHKPTGLIRFASYNSIQNGIQKLISPRVLGYTAILTGLVIILGFSLLTRTEVETTVLKVPGTLYQLNDNGGVTNLYNVEFVNKTFEDLPLELKVIDPPFASITRPDNNPIIVPAESMMKVICFLELPAASILESRTIITLGVYRNGQQVEKLKVKFIGPIKSKL
jgi:cytochrome c oxidase accessory protein FixG